MAIVTLDKQKRNKYRSLIPYIESEFPEHVRLIGGGSDIDPATKQSLLIEFIRRYYDWLESTGQAQNRFNSLELLFDVNYGMEVFFEQYRKQFIASIPASFASTSSRPEYTKSLVIKNARQIYRSKGTEASIEFLFRFLFNDEARVTYPKKYFDQVAEASVQTDPFIRFVLTDIISGDPVTELETRTIYGVSSGASAIVERVQLGSIQGTSFYELKLSRVIGVFQRNERIETRDTRFPNQTAFFVTGLVVAAQITLPGTQYASGTRIPFIGEDALFYDGSAFYINDFDYSGFTTRATFWDGTIKWEGTRRFNTVINSIYIWDGTFDWDGEINWGDNTGIGGGSGIGASAFIEQIGPNGEIIEVRIAEPGILYESPPISNLTQLGDGSANVQFAVGTIFYRVAEFYNFDGNFDNLAPQNRITVQTDYVTTRGSVFSTAPEEFTYFIESLTPVTEYSNILDANMHPAGMKYIGILNLVVFENAANAKMYTHYQPAGVNSTNPYFIWYYLDHVIYDQTTEINIVEQYLELNSSVLQKLERVGEVQRVGDFSFYGLGFYGSDAMPGFYDGNETYSSTSGILDYRLDDVSRNSSLQFGSNWTLPQFRKYTSGKAYYQLQRI